MRVRRRAHRAEWYTKPLALRRILPWMDDWHLGSPNRRAFARLVLAGVGGFVALGAAFALVPAIVVKIGRAHV